MTQITKCFNKNILLLVFLVEILSCALHYFGYDFIRASLVVKGFILAAFLSKIYQKKWIYFGVLFIIFFTSFLIVDVKLFSNDLLELIFSFSKYMFFPITFFYFKGLLSDEDLYISLKKQFTIIFLISYFFIITGYLFDIDFFRTYRWTRFGYNGIFVSQNESSYILLCGFFYFFWIAKNNINVLNIFKIGLSVVALSLVGTKTIYFSLLLFLIRYFLYKRNILTNIFTFFTAVIIVIITLNYGVISSFYDLYLEKGFWYSLTSFRSDYIQTRFIYQIENCWTWLNYLFGGSFTLCYKLIEMEIFDLFVFFGIIGSIVYSFTIYKACNSFFYNKFTYFIGFILFIASFFSGHFFLSGSVGIYLAALMFLIKEDQRRGLGHIKNEF